MKRKWPTPRKTKKWSCTTESTADGQWWRSCSICHYSAGELWQWHRLFLWCS